MDEKKKILEMLAELRPEFDYENSSNFVEDGLLDSFDIVSLTTMLEEYFKVTIDGMCIVPENYASVDAILALVKSSKGAN
ncbi:acyl carrier protein [uncultured Fibrobacter sp.]|uniref:acyl carrier protein n=1 Tax=uncultured Fibrobacter sp. TaxID=261512 RepID=UPI0025CB90B5|nr:acyl carrier protein [uncultured Fibrobacter sp.]